MCGAWFSYGTSSVYCVCGACRSLGACVAVVSCVRWGSRSASSAIRYDVGDLPAMRVCECPI